MSTVFIAAGSCGGMGGSSHLHTFDTMPDAAKFITRARLMIFQQPQYIANQLGAIEWGIYSCEIAEVDDALDRLITALKGD